MDLVRSLGLAGIPCAVFARRGRPTRYSRFVRERVDWVDIWSDLERGLETLLRFGSAQADRPVLYYNGDRELLLISRFRERLQQAFRFVVADATLVEDLVDKARFQTLAERLGLPVPPAQHLSPGKGSRPEDVRLEFPLVVKQLTRHQATWTRVTGGKALHVDTRDALRQLWPLLTSSGEDVLLQEAISGPESLIESYHVYVTESGDIGGEFTVRKIRTYPARYGYSTALVITDEADVGQLGRDLVERLDFHGVAKFDFKRGSDGKLHLLEVNPRFNLWHHPGAVAGVNLPAMVYCDLVGMSRPASGLARPGVQWCSLRDVKAARVEGVSLSRWLRWAWGVEAKSVIAWDDPMPLVRSVAWRLGQKLQVIPTLRRMRRVENPEATERGDDEEALVESSIDRWLQP